MSVIILTILLVSIVGQAIAFLHLQKKIDQQRNLMNATLLSLKTIHGRIDKIFAVDPAKENEATIEKDEGVEFSEQNYINIPQGVKFELEGGDSQVPPGFEDKA